MIENTLEGRNAVIEALRAEKTLEKLYIQAGLKDGPINTIIKQAKKNDIQPEFITKERLDKLSATKKHQGFIAIMSAYDYSTVDEILEIARNKGESPFILILDSIEDPYNLGAIIRTANQAGVHGIIIPKHRAVGLRASVARTSAGAINYTPVAKVTNISKTIEELKKEGLWFICADMSGTSMYEVDFKGAIGIVIGNEGSGVSESVKKKCDFLVSIPMFGDIDSLNVSVATGILAYEAVRQRRFKI